MIKIPPQLCVPSFGFVLLRVKDKAAFESKWEQKPYAYNDGKLQLHIRGDGNYGIIGGHGDLVLIDCDNEEMKDIIIKSNLPETFYVCREGGAGHFYFLCEGVTNADLYKDGVHVGEIRAKNRYVVAPGSIHPTGNEYKVINDVPIARVKKEDILEAIGSYIKITTPTAISLTEETDDAPGVENILSVVENLRKFSKYDKLLNGDETGYPTTSEAEMAVVGSLKTKGMNFAQVDYVMRNICTLGKWSQANDGYRKLTYGKVKKKEKTNPLISTPQKADVEIVSLDGLYEIYDKWLSIKDRGRIDVVLATALTQQDEGSPIWLFIIGPSGDGKSEQVMALENPEITFVVNEITPNTLVSGMSTARENYDLAPRIKNKIVIIPDMAALLNMHPQDKMKVWGQLRELYDGRAGKTTGVSSATYEGIRVTMIACSTPNIDAQTTIFNSLGTRELHFRTYEGEHIKVMEKVLENEKVQKQMKEELRNITRKFIKCTKFKKIEWPNNVKQAVINMVDYLRFLRAGAELDSYSGELRTEVYPEQPTRVLIQLYRIYQALKSLDENYEDDRALDIIRHIVRSSISHNRKAVLDCFKEDDDVGAYIVANRCKIGTKTATRELNVLWNMGFLHKTEEEFMDREWNHRTSWKINRRGLELRDKLGER